ncbi:CDK-activating kinase assembly factor MAT1-domain-containing protein [Radiomyces spectabilis]|uniref:CDK-activating kinase assembly factor MAT1-domain-containing protein n=1 Tax=Radiomyces spectabilis TaxID=64574 RepID=UPI00222115E1|nr:CDK-activating kinase assembly factor MAT1-domain-containing protein [Radiomyces spectabilis]KAI8366631.1 CDK-activating kinase assembly factor MAT1-domain-containing protein [Radiomyces spectabilis]
MADGTLRSQTLMIGRTGSSVVSYQEEDAQCPVCKSDKYLTPNLKLLVSPCFHKMCESCIDRLFSAGPAPCPLCHQVLRKNQFMSQIFEDLTVEKEVRIRKRVGKVFNKRPEDFPSLRLYNDYLEMVEDITFNLMNEVDVAETEARITAYELENKESIAENQARLANEQRYSSYQDELEKQEREQKREDYLRQLEEERREKELEKAELIKELATSNKSAQAVLATRATALKRSSALRQQSESNTPSPRLNMPSWLIAAMDTDTEMKEAELANFDPFGLEYDYSCGFEVRENYSDAATDYLNGNKAARAGGYAPRFAYQRALNSAFAGILCPPIQNP